MKLILPLTLALFAVALSPAAAGAATTATRDCGQIAFTPHSDDMASDIVAKGVTCKVARGFIRAVDGNAPKRFRGYRCTSRTLDSALPAKRYRCVDGAREIRWTKT